MVERSEGISVPNANYMGFEPEACRPLTARSEIGVLLIEDDPGDAFMVKETFVEAGVGEFKLSCVERLRDALTRLDEESFDVLLCDLSLPDAVGLETVRELYNRSRGIPIVVLTGTDDELMGIKAVQLGAQDYLVKGHVTGDLMLHSIRYAIERSRMAAELERARYEQMRLKDQFLSHVSHELRSPLTSIYEFTSILLDKIAGDLTDDQRQYLEVIMSNVKQFRGMIDALLDVTRAQTGKLVIDPHCISLKDAILKSVANFEAHSAKDRISIEIDLPGFLPSVYADADRLVQVLNNLIDNAIKFTPHRGTIIVKAGVSNSDPNSLYIAVSDTGCGISAEGAERIFSNLYQENNEVEMSRKGLGLGLFICREIVTRHGGKIWVESVLGQGSTFYFTLPTFSLSRLLNVILSDTTQISDPVSLITIDVVPLGTSGSSTFSEATSREIWHLLSKCVLPSNQALLPRMARSESSETFYIIARTDQSEAEQIGSRVRQQVESLPAFYDLELRVTTRVLIGDPAGQNDSAQTMREVRSRVIDLIRADLYEKGYIHE